MLEKKDLKEIIKKYEKSLKSNEEAMDKAKDEEEYTFYSKSASEDEKAIDLLRYLLTEYYN